MPFVAGQILTATALNTLAPLVARKTADETVNNSAVLQNDNELVLAVEANTSYIVWCHLVQQSGTTPDFKFEFTFPTGATRAGWNAFGGNTANWQATLANANGGSSGINGTGANSSVDVYGLLVVGSTAGNLQLVWAQNTANASDTIVRAGSFLHLTRVIT